MRTIVWCLLFSVLLMANFAIAESSKRPNVLFIAVDDLNDWIGCLGGHPQAKTPHIDRLASQGVLFERAFCAAPLCNPSRTAVMTGLRPSTTGVYCNRGWFREHPQYQDWQTIPQYFRTYGYKAWMGGKIYHKPGGKKSDPIAWDKQYHTAVGTPNPPEERRFLHGMKGKFTTSPYFNNSLDWGPIDVPKEETADWKTADLAAKFLKQEHDKPFFLACGIFRPHLIWYAPREFFELHDVNQVVLPPYKENDLDDVPSMGKRLARKDFPIIRDSGQWQAAVHGYLACSSFADACVGHVLDALAKSRYGDNTIVVLWGDHGWHLGQKDHWSKFAMWEQTNRTPLIIYAPNRAGNTLRCTNPVSLVDLYPTLIELCGLPKRQDLDGRSLAPLLDNPAQSWPYPALMTHWRNNHGLRNNRYHYIRYRDGGEELYDLKKDPHEWYNLAGNAQYQSIIQDLSKWLPQNNAEHFQPEPPENM